MLSINQKENLLSCFCSIETSLKILVFTIILLIFFFLIWWYYSLFFQTSVAVGVDGYYYVLQINSLWELGHFYFATYTPLILYFFSVLAFFIGDATPAVKYGAIILQIFLCLSVASFLHILTKNIWLSMLGILLIVLSVLHLYFLSEFLSNLGGLTFMIWSGFNTVKTIQTKKKIWFVLTVLALSCAILSHRSIFWLVVCFLSFILFAHLWLSYVINTTQHFIYRHILFGAIVLVLFFLPFILAWQPLFVLPQWLSSELLKYPRNPFHSLILIESLMLSAVSIALLLILFSKPEILHKSLTSLILLPIILWSLLFNLNPFLNHQTGISGVVGRLDLLIYLQTAIAIPLLVSILFCDTKKLVFLIIIFSLMLLVLRWFIPLPAGLRPEFLKTREEIVSELPVMNSQICEDPIIIAQHGEQFLVTTVLKISSQQKPPYGRQFQCIFWLIHQPKTDYQIVFEEGMASPSGKFILIENSKMQKKIKTMDADERHLLIVANPHLRFLLY